MMSLSASMRLATSDARKSLSPKRISSVETVSFSFIMGIMLYERSVRSVFFELMYFFLPFFAGFILGYLFYDISHYAIHHFNMHSKFWLAIKNHHMLHHYQDEYKGYGVSSPFWDIIFGTTFKKKSN